MNMIRAVFAHFRKKQMIEHFPPEFDSKFYRSKNQDLRNHGDVELKQHYDLFGRSEGRAASPMAHRHHFVTAFSRAHKALEIGPFNKPMLSGPNANFFDVIDQEALRKRAASINEKGNTVPIINYISPVGDLTVVNDHFDLVVSSHSIEHQPDLIRHLQQVERILKENGAYAVLVPDCRYCFDHTLPPSHIGHVLDAYYTERSVHRLADVIEHRAMTTHNDSQRHWQADHGSASIDINSVRNALLEWQNSSGSYIDVHAWQFTPDTFAQIVDGLYELNLTKLRIGRVYHTPFGINEFCAVLIR